MLVLFCTVLSVLYISSALGQPEASTTSPRPPVCRKFPLLHTKAYHTCTAPTFLAYLSSLSCSSQLKCLGLFGISALTLTLKCLTPGKRPCCPSIPSRITAVLRRRIYSCSNPRTKLPLTVPARPPQSTSMPWFSPTHAVLKHCVRILHVKYTDYGYACVVVALLFAYMQLPLQPHLFVVI